MRKNSRAPTRTSTGTSERIEERAVIERTAHARRRAASLKLRYDENDHASIASAESVRREHAHPGHMGRHPETRARAAARFADRHVRCGSSTSCTTRWMLECDAPEADAMALKLEAAMVTAGQEFIDRVPIKTDVHIADEWAK